MQHTKKHTIIHIATISKKWFLWIFVLLCVPSSIWGQEGLKITGKDKGKISLEYSVTSISAKATDEGYATLVMPAANSHTCDAGRPMLPTARKLIAIPDNYKITIEEDVWDTIDLDLIGCHVPLMPYGGANTKDSYINTAVTDIEYYKLDSLMGGELVSIEPLGKMRGSPISAITISPVRYNPKEGVISVCRRLRATITFPEEKQDSNDNSPLFRALGNNIMDCSRPNDSKDYVNTMTDGTNPQGYLVVSGTRFRETLKPLLTWKRQEGYIVDELYFDYGDLTSVKDSLQNRYDNATPNHPAPLFILIVGDLDDIALWTPRHNIQGLETHRSDFYFAEFTGDMLPDAMIGRISVKDTMQLRNVIEKTIAYEKGEPIDTLSLRRSLLVAGREYRDPAPSTTNGQVNYLKQLLIEHDPNHDTICFYNPSSSDNREDIMAAIRQGVGLINYTAHCNSRGWRNPFITNSDINDSNLVDNHLFIAVNNCCRSNDVASECFGEMLLRKAGGGAVGAIGAVNETLWEEDYYWSVGVGDITSTPSADSTSSGAFDRLLHPNLQPFDEQAWTLGQMLLAGNFAVTASGSPYADFYWEIYLLLGDPSLMPHIGPIYPMMLSCDSVKLGDTITHLNGTPWAKVAATCGDTLMGLCTLDANGEGSITFQQPVASSICITATRQFHKAKQMAFKLTDDNNGTIGIASINSTNICIFPNPSHGEITIRGIDNNTRLTIYDATGRKMMTTTVDNDETLSFGKQLPPGLYTLMFSNSQGLTVKKIAIKR